METPSARRAVDGARHDNGGALLHIGEVEVNPSQQHRDLGLELLTRLLAWLRGRWANDDDGAGVAPDDAKVLEQRPPTLT